jgi:D-alanyl-D-alanine carboxypeptidase
VNRYLIVGAAVALALLHSPANAQTPSQAQFAQLQKSFQAELDKLRAEQGFPGATAAFVLPDGRMVKVSSGDADVERNVAMTPDTRLMSGSTGKTFAAALAILMDKKGQWSLDDKLSRYLGSRPWFNQLPNANDITIRILLQHRSGLENHYDNPRFFEILNERRAKDQATALTFTREELIGFVLNRPPLFPAGKGYNYTDLGYILVGEAIESATGRNYYDVLREQLLDPLGLALTDPSALRTLPGLAQGYAKEPGPLVPDLKMLDDRGRLVYDPALEFAGGGLVTNAGDLARWMHALFQGNALPKDGAMDMLACPAAPTKSEMNKHYGMGMGVKLSNRLLGVSYGHGGYIMGYQSSMRFYPKYGIAVAFQINSEDGVWNEGKPKAKGEKRVDIGAMDLSLAQVAVQGSTVRKAQSIVVAGCKPHG